MARFERPRQTSRATSRWAGVSVRRRRIRSLLLMGTAFEAILLPGIRNAIPACFVLAGPTAPLFENLSMRRPLGRGLFMIDTTNHTAPAPVPATTDNDEGSQ